MSDFEQAADAPLVDPTPTRVTTATPPAPRPAVAPNQWALEFGRFFYTHNPFYVASAWMVFSGLRASFPSSSATLNVGALTLSLMVYTLLLSLTAYLVIRLGKVWEDARSLLLLIVLMVLGISVTLDRVLANSADQAMPYYFLGWLFAAATCELLLRLLPLGLGWLFRGPFHLLLALLFFYPLTLAARLQTPYDPVLAWQLFGFAPIAALIFLGLIPAVRRGPAYVADNGSPWQWPWYPWILFGVLGFCVALRTYSLCVSLHFVPFSQTIFAPYFLVPLGLAGSVLLLEAGVVAGSKNVVRWALMLPVPLMLMAAVDRVGDPVYQAFVSQFEQTLGMTPLVVTCWLAAGFYLMAAVRSVAEANYPLIATLVVLALVPALDRVGAMDPWPLALAGAWQIGLGWRFGRSGDVVVGSCLALASATVAGQGTWLLGWQGMLPVHLLLALLMVAGYWYRDQTGYYARRAAVVLAVCLAAAAALGGARFHVPVPDWARTFYPLAVAALLAGYGHLTADGAAYVGAAAAAVVGSLDVSGRIYNYLYYRIAGLHQLVWGVLFFLLAALISLFKSPLRPGWMRRRFFW